MSAGGHLVGALTLVAVVGLPSGYLVASVSNSATGARLRAFNRVVLAGITVGALWITFAPLYLILALTSNGPTSLGISRSIMPRRTNPVPRLPEPEPEPVAVPPSATALRRHAATVRAAAIVAARKTGG